MSMIFQKEMKPMPHFTPQKLHPDSKQLTFLSAFARLYTPHPDNEKIARALALVVAEGNEKEHFN